MSMQGNLFAAAADKRARMVDIRPGSTIRVHDNENGIPDFEARVIETKAEYGPNSMPALIVLANGSGQQIILTDSGKWRIDVLIDASVLLQSAPSEHLVLVQQRPSNKTAIRFVGGPESAVEVIQWAGGRAVIAYNQGNDSAPDTLTIPTLEGVMVAEVGDWVVRGVTGEFYPVKPNVFEMSYDIVGGPQQAFDSERDSTARPTTAPLPQSPFEQVGLSLAAQMAQQGVPDPRVAVGVPQPSVMPPSMQPGFGGFGGEPGFAPMSPLGALERDNTDAGNPLGIPQGGAHA